MQQPVGGDILIIDDTPANLQLLSSILTERGHEIRAVISGQMGLIAARTMAPDLILLDIKMPGMDGYEMCQRLKADEDLRGIPVIFISSLEDTIDKVKAFEVGGVDYITKPFHVEEVIARVESQLTLYRHHQQELELITIQERQRLARDLHDAVSQTLFSVSMLAETLLFRYRDDPEQIEDDLRQIHQLSQSALTEMRMLLFELRPETLIKASISDLLSQLATILKQRTNADVILTTKTHIKLPPPVHIACYRIAQEALNNVIKHARASSISIKLDDYHQYIELEISDNGRGFQVTDMPPHRFGLSNMRERAEAIGAELKISSKLDCGTTIMLTWRRD